MVDGGTRRTSLPHESGKTTPGFECNGVPPLLISETRPAATLMWRVPFCSIRHEQYPATEGRSRDCLSCCPGTGPAASATQDRRQLKSCSWGARLYLNHQAGHRPQPPNESSGSRTWGLVFAHFSVCVAEKIFRSTTIAAGRLTNPFQCRHFHAACNLRLWHTICNFPRA
jgi:hypothetical protein